MRNTERSGNELCHGDRGDYGYEFDSRLYFCLSTFNPGGSNKGSGSTMEFQSNRILE